MKNIAKYIYFVLVLFTGFAHANTNSFEPLFCGKNNLEKTSQAQSIKSICFGQTTHEDMLFRSIQIEFNDSTKELWVEYSWNPISPNEIELELMLYNSKDLQKTKAMIFLDNDGAVYRVKGTTLNKIEFDSSKTSTQTISNTLQPRMNVQDEGNKQSQAIILLHGNGMSLNSFSEISRSLSSRYRVISYDQRGHGHTYYDGLNFSLPAMVNDLKIVLDALDVQKAHLVGHSFGARIALAFAAQYPERVLSVVNEDMELRPRELASDEQCTSYALQIKKQIADYAPYAWGCFANAADLRGTLLRYQGPVLVMRANPAHTAISEEGLKEMQALKPTIKTVNFAQASHTIHQSLPKEYLIELTKFLETKK